MFTEASTSIRPPTIVTVHGRTRAPASSALRSINRPAMTTGAPIGPKTQVPQIRQPTKNQRSPLSASCSAADDGGGAEEGEVGAPTVAAVALISEPPVLDQEVRHQHERFDHQI